MSNTHFNCNYRDIIFIAIISERTEKERILNEKLAKKRRVRLKKLQAQQKKTKDDLEAKIKQSTNTQDLQVRSHMHVYLGLT